MTLPVIISTTEEALRSVPLRFRVVGLSLGATQWYTIRKVILPQAMPGILTGVILGLERAAGETAPILFTGAALLPTAPAAFTPGCYYGAALSHLRHLHPGTRHAHRHPVRHSACLARIRAGDESGCHAHSFAGAQTQAVVKP